MNSRQINTPENQAHIDELAQSIAMHGVITPLTVYWENGSAVLTDGECRLLATFRAIEVYSAPVHTVPVKIEPKGANEADRLLTQIIANSGKPFNAIENGAVYKRLLAFGWTMAQVAQRAGISVSKISDTLDGKVPGESNREWEFTDKAAVDPRSAMLEAELEQERSNGAADRAALADELAATRAELEFERGKSAKQPALIDVAKLARVFLEKQADLATALETFAKPAEHTVEAPALAGAPVAANGSPSASTGRTKGSQAAHKAWVTRRSNAAAKTAAEGSRKIPS
jgi:ParB-like chromosome segregation protein Spo0J